MGSTRQSSQSQCCSQPDWFHELQNYYLISQPVCIEVHVTRQGRCAMRQMQATAEQASGVIVLSIAEQASGVIVLSIAEQAHAW